VLFVRVALYVLCAAAGTYQAIAFLAVVRQLVRRKRKLAPGALPVSILKPVRGIEEGFREAVASHAAQEYPPGFEILLGVGPGDAEAAAEINRLAAELPGVPIRGVVCHQETANAKVGRLMDLARQARHPWLVINDSDIRVPPGYLADVTAPLCDPRIGVVTCLYRATGSTLAARFEALGIATDFAPSTLVAPMFGVREFGLGSTLAFRREDLEAIGGFGAVSDYLADDYQIGARIHRLGRVNQIARTVVETGLGAADWTGVWRHQVRWARTIRVSNGIGFSGLPITCATLWAILALSAGTWPVAAGLAALRLMVALVCGVGLLGSKDVARLIWLVPARDLFALAVWAAGMGGDTVEWRGRRLRLARDGRITPI
jgi:ceramide glucosyltransferase